MFVGRRLEDCAFAESNVGFKQHYFVLYDSKTTPFVLFLMQCLIAASPPMCSMKMSTGHT